MGQSIDLFRKSGFSLPNTPSLNSSNSASSGSDDGDVGVRALLGAGEFSYLLGQANEKISKSTNPFDALKKLSSTALDATLGTQLPGVTQSSEHISDMYHSILDLLSQPDLIEKFKITPSQLQTIQKEFKNNSEVLERLRTSLLATNSSAASQAATSGGIINPTEKAALDQRSEDLGKHVHRVHFSALMSISEILSSDQFSGLFSAMKASKESQIDALKATKNLSVPDVVDTPKTV